jgi:hypothetical protein
MTFASGGTLGFLHAMASGQAPSSQWPVYGLGVAALLYIILRPMMRRKKDALDGAGPSLGLAQQRSVEREMSNLLVELSEMARQVSAQLDTRSARLEALMDEADRRIAELRRLSQPPAGGVQRQPGEDSFAPPERQPIADQRHLDVYHLADEGNSPQEIAHRLGRPQGEVELILALRR